MSLSTIVDLFRQCITDPNSMGGLVNPRNKGSDSSSPLINIIKINLTKMPRYIKISHIKMSPFQKVNFFIKSQ